MKILENKQYEHFKKKKPIRALHVYYCVESYGDCKILFFYHLSSAIK